ncbi:MAG: hypothetical protein ACYTFK_13840, partial [Planctomycetota bacterium]
DHEDGIILIGTGKNWLNPRSINLLRKCNLFRVAVETGRLDLEGLLDPKPKAKAVKPIGRAKKKDKGRIPGDTGKAGEE